MDIVVDAAGEMHAQEWKVRVRHGMGRLPRTRCSRPAASTRYSPRNGRILGEGSAPASRAKDIGLQSGADHDLVEPHHLVWRLHLDLAAPQLESPSLCG